MRSMERMFKPVFVFNSLTALVNFKRVAGSFARTRGMISVSIRLRSINPTTSEVGSAESGSDAVATAVVCADTIVALKQIKRRNDRSMGRSSILLAFRTSCAVEGDRSGRLNKILREL